MRKVKFEGVIPAVPTPFNEREDVNHEAMTRLIDRLIEQGVGGLFINGSTAEWWSLTDDERMALAETAVAAAAGRTRVMVHVGASSTRAAVRLAEHAESIGADAVSALPPVGRTFPAQAVWDHFAAIGRSCALPLYLYHLPQQYGDLITVEKFIEALDIIPTLAGAKFSSYRVDELICLRTQAGDRLNVLSGCGEQLLSATACGAEGSICTWYNLLPRLGNHIIACVKAGDVEEARKHEEILVRAGRLWIPNSLGYLKRLIARRGIDVGQPRRPWPPLSHEDFEAALPGIEATGVLDWCI